MSTPAQPINNAAPTPAPAAAPNLSGLDQPGPAAQPVAPNINAPAPAPVDVQSGTPQPNMQTAAMGSMAQATADEAAAYKKANDMASVPFVPPTIPHSKLLNIIAAIGAGLSGAGTAIATHGKEGGAPEVQEIMGARQNQQIQRNDAALAQRNSAIQQQLQIGATNHQLAQSYLNLMTLPDEMTKSHVEAQAAQQNLSASEADFRAAHMGLAPNDFNAAMSGTGTPGATSDVFKSRAQQTLGAATQILGANDPYVQKLQTVLANPQSAPKDLWAATQQVEGQQKMQGEVIDAKTKQDTLATNAPFGPDRSESLNDAMLQRYQVLNPGAKTLPSGLVMSPNSTPKDFDRVDKILQQTETAQATKANRDVVNGMRAQTLALSGLGAPGGNTQLQGDDYLKTLPAPEKTLVQSIGSGKIAVDRMAYLIARNPKLLQEVTLAYPDFDSSKAAAYPATYKDFTSGKTAVALNAGGTALGHLYELKELNTPESHIPHTPAWTAYQNKAATVSTELAKFYGDATIPAIENIKSTLTSTLPGNRDAAIRTQAQSMGDKLDAYDQQWKNAAPSSRYEASLPGISPKAMAARAALDPNYAASQQQSNSAAASTTPTVSGLTNLHTNPQTKQQIGWNGTAWVDVKTGAKVQ
jgi:hypothetical protein